MPKNSNRKIECYKSSWKRNFRSLYHGWRPRERFGWSSVKQSTFLEDLSVSAIEVGIPFSDPVADGPVIEEAGLRSLAHGTSTQALVETLKTIETEVPLVIMTYFNPSFSTVWRTCQRFGRYSG